MGWPEVIIVTFLDAAVTVDVPQSKLYSDTNLVETRILHFARLLLFIADPACSQANVAVKYVK